VVVSVHVEPDEGGDSHDRRHLAAEITNIGGLLDLRTRRLVPDPGDIWRSAANAPELLGL